MLRLSNGCFGPSDVCLSVISAPSRGLGTTYNRYIAFSYVSVFLCAVCCEFSDHSVIFLQKILFLLKLNYRDIFSLFCNDYLAKIFSIGLLQVLVWFKR